MQTGKMWAEAGEPEAAEAALGRALQLGTRCGQVGRPPLGCSGHVKRLAYRLRSGVQTCRPFTDCVCKQACLPTVTR